MKEAWLESNELAGCVCVCVCNETCQEKIAAEWWGGVTKEETKRQEEGGQVPQPNQSPT